MRSITPSQPARRTRRLVERRARRRPVIVATATAACALTLVGFAGAVPVSYAEASAATPVIALASFTTPADVAAPPAEAATEAAATEARETIADAAASVAAAESITADIAAAGLDIGVADTTVETSELEEAADRLQVGLSSLPAPLLPDVTAGVGALAESIDEKVADLRGRLDAAIAEKQRKEAEEKARLEAEEKARQAAAAAASAPSSGGGSYPTAPIPSGNGNGDNSPAGAQAYAYSRLGAYGWGGDQFGCLVSLWNKESGWNYLAYNRSSGAYGIPQALPGSKMGSAGADWQTNAATQVNWGLGYIAGRYGTPCGAWGHSQSVGWY